MKKDYSMREIMEQFKRIDKEMGTNSTPVDSIRREINVFRDVVNGGFSSLNETKRQREQRENWDKPFGFFKDLNEARDFIHVSKEDTLVALREALQNFLVNNGWSSTAHGNERAVYDHPEYSKRTEDHAKISLGTVVYEYPTGGFAYGFSLFINHSGTGDIKYVGSVKPTTEAIDVAYQQIMQRALEYDPDDYLI